MNVYNNTVRKYDNKNKIANNLHLVLKTIKATKRDGDKFGNYISLVFAELPVDLEIGKSVYLPTGQIARVTNIGGNTVTVRNTNINERAEMFNNQYLLLLNSTKF